jgi:hypothetical protein
VVGSSFAMTPPEGISLGGVDSSLLSLPLSLLPDTSLSLSYSFSLFGTLALSSVFLTLVVFLFKAGFFFS